MSEKKPDHGPPTIDVLVFGGQDPDGQSFSWPQTMKVGDAAAEAAAALGVDLEAPTFQNEDNEVLDREKPLVAAKVKSGAKLDLVSAGGGV